MPMGGRGRVGRYPPCVAAEAAECDWCATDPVTGQFRSTQQRSDAQTFVKHLESLRRVGAGYAEVSHVGRPFPWLAVSLSGDSGVVHHFASAERSLLLRGDGSLGGTSAVEVPVFEETQLFTGEYVSTAERAFKVVEDFVAGVEPGSLGEWDAL